MPTRFFHTAGRSLAIPALFALVAVLSFSGAFAQAPAKKVVKTEADLPRFNYPLTTTATELLKSDDATFNAFAAKVRADVDSVLNDYDVRITLPCGTWWESSCNWSCWPATTKPH